VLTKERQREEPDDKTAGEEEQDGHSCVGNALTVRLCKRRLRSISAVSSRSRGTDKHTVRAQKMENMTIAKAHPPNSSFFRPILSTSWAPNRLTKNKNAT